MVFKDIKPGMLFHTLRDRAGEHQFCKVPHPQPWDGRPCDACGVVAVWNARRTEDGCLVHFCPGEEIIPVVNHPTPKGGGLRE
ncbi:MAG: hypothetical protein K6T65_01525 [Peptococcaceae bacterium]|nr:hypothetical protein [Peptococcaceae bacterium]